MFGSWLRLVILLFFEMGFAIDGDEEVQLFGMNDVPSPFNPFMIRERLKMRSACSAPASGY